MNEVLSALQTLYTDPSSSAKESANRWLQNFQKEPEAWETANLILASPDAPSEPKLFAAQTFKTKIIYDLDQLPSEHRLPLRDTLLAALSNIGPGERGILTQLCLAIADLLLQLPEWTNALQGLIDQLGSRPDTVPALLHFLEVLPEELGNTRIRVTNNDWRTENTGAQVIQLISMYFQAPGVTPQVRRQTLTCLKSWVYAGELTPSLVLASPFFDFAFSSLSSDDLFDDSIDLLCSLIHETQEVGDNLPVIEAIVPRLVALRPNLTTAIQAGDSDQVRGFCRLFVEAGEWYAQLMLQHPANFFPIVEAIADCSAYDDLDVVTITLNFWWKLAVGLKKGGFANDPSCQPFLEIIGRLVDTVISHLRYPQDPNTLSGQDRDDFRSFRHDIGNTLKDCCSVLGAQTCLARSLSIIEAEMAKGDQGLSWQAIEAALFSMRAMGAQVDRNENEVMPRIFAAIPQLPTTQSKIRYAATLVVARYTEWLAVHSELIPAMLEYTLAGFSVNQDETAVASASALKYLCKDCSQYLVSYLPPLFQFTQEHGSKLHQDDYLDICEGFASVISTMPPNDAIPAMQTFCAPMIEQVHALVSRPDATAPKSDLTACSDALERLNIFLNINNHFSDSLPNECASTASDIWQILDGLLQKYGNSSVAERACSTIRRGLTFFGRLALPLAPAILDRMTAAFEQGGVSGYVWIAGRVPELLRLPEVDANSHTNLKTHLAQTFNSMTAKLATMLSASSPAEVQDCIEDYLHLVRNLAETTPDLLFLSPAFPSAVQIAVTAVTLLNAHVCHDGIDTLRTIIGHDSLSPNLNMPGFDAKQSVNMSQYAQAIRSTISQPDVGGRLVGIMLSRLVTDFHEDCAPMSITLARLLAERFPQELAQWVPAAIAQISPKDLREPERQKFLSSFNEGLSTNNLGKVRTAFTNLDRATKKERERASLR